MSQVGDVLQDGSLRLRPLRLPDDIPLALPWYHDPEILRFSEGEGTSPYDATIVDQMYTALAADGEIYVIEIRTAAGWRAIGDAALCPGALPIVIGVPEFRSRGLGARVLRLLIARARTLGWTRLVVKGVFTYNHRARRLYERAGFRVVDRVDDPMGRPMWRLELSLPTGHWD